MCMCDGELVVQETRVAIRYVKLPAGNSLEHNVIGRKVHEHGDCVVGTVAHRRVIGYNTK